jgi:hypothetical protein
MPPGWYLKCVVLGLSGAPIVLLAPPQDNVSGDNNPPVLV